MFTFNDFAQFSSKKWIQLESVCDACSHSSCVGDLKCMQNVWIAKWVDLNMCRLEFFWMVLEINIWSTLRAIWTMFNALHKWILFHGLLWKSFVFQEKMANCKIKKGKSDKVRVGFTRFTVKWKITRYVLLSAQKWHCQALWNTKRIIFFFLSRSATPLIHIYCLIKTDSNAFVIFY